MKPILSLVCFAQPNIHIVFIGAFLAASIRIILTMMGIQWTIQNGGRTTAHDAFLSWNGGQRQPRNTRWFPILSQNRNHSSRLPRNAMLRHKHGVVARKRSFVSQ